MKWLRAFIQWLKSWIRPHVPKSPVGQPRGRDAPFFAVVGVEELPDQLAAQALYVVGENGNDWNVAFLCPCGCGAVIQLGLLRDSSPRWSVCRHEDGTVSLSPSVWRQIGCRSHFYVSRSRIAWVSRESH